MDRPIGIFDSGVGGLTVVKEILNQLPNEEIIYFGDTARVPYGTKSSETIRRFSIEDAEFLMRFDVKLIVVACNTASSISLPFLKKRFRVPVIGVIKPGAEEAVRLSKNNKIGVLGTRTTIQSRSYEKEVHRISKKIKVESISCPLFVPLVEEGWTDNNIALEIAHKYLDPLKKEGVDTVILGCTHYPLLKDVIQMVLGNGVRLIDSAKAVSKEVKKILKYGGITRQTPVSNSKNRCSFFVSDAAEQFVKVGHRFLGSMIKNVKRAEYV